MRFEVRHVSVKIDLLKMRAIATGRALPLLRCCLVINIHSCFVSIINTNDESVNNDTCSELKHPQIIMESPGSTLAPGEWDRTSRFQARGRLLAFHHQLMHARHHPSCRHLCQLLGTVFQVVCRALAQSQCSCGGTVTRRSFKTYMACGGQCVTRHTIDVK